MDDFPRSPWGRRPRTVWFCPFDGCDYQEEGLYDHPLGDGVCEKKEHRTRRLKRRRPDVPHG